MPARFAINESYRVPSRRLFSKREDARQLNYWRLFGQLARERKGNRAAKQLNRALSSYSRQLQENVGGDIYCR
jgi:hypothetical protein